MSDLQTGPISLHTTAGMTHKHSVENEVNQPVKLKTHREEEEFQSRTGDLLLEERKDEILTRPRFNKACDRDRRDIFHCSCVGKAHLRISRTTTSKTERDLKGFETRTCYT